MKVSLPLWSMCNFLHSKSMHHITLLTLLILSTVSNASQDNPNIIFILADDLGWTDINCRPVDEYGDYIVEANIAYAEQYDSKFHKTPALSKLRADGIRFTNAYSTCPHCNPTRVALMTGKYPFRAGLIDNDYKTGSLSLAETTIAEALDNHGVDYNSAFMGKWHLSALNAKPAPEYYDPLNQGFEVNVAGSYYPCPIGAHMTKDVLELCYWWNGNSLYNKSPIQNYGMGPWPEATYHRYYPESNNFSNLEINELNNPYINKILNDYAPNDDEYLTDRLTWEAMDFITQASQEDRPFFLYLSHYGPHTPITSKKHDYLQPVAHYRFDKTCHIGDESRNSANFITYSQSLYDGTFFPQDSNYNPISIGEGQYEDCFAPISGNSNCYFEINGGTTDDQYSYKGIGGCNSRTVMAYINSSNSICPDRQVIISWGKSQVNAKWEMFLDENTGQLAIGIFGVRLKGGANLRDGNWHHVAAVLPEGCDNIKQVELFVDGLSVTTNSDSLNAIINTSQTENVLIGASDCNDADDIQEDSVSAYFQGLIDEVTIYDKGLSSDQIQNIYQDYLPHVYGDYAGMIESVDDSVGAIREHLINLNIDDNTIIIFTSDNGGDGYTSNYPLKGYKAQMYEGGSRVPMIVYWPDAMKDNQGNIVRTNETCSVPVSSIDIMPTILDMAYSQERPSDNYMLDGVSLVDIIDNPGNIQSNITRYDNAIYSIYNNSIYTVIGTGQSDLPNSKNSYDFKYGHYNTSDIKLYKIHENGQLVEHPETEAYAENDRDSIAATLNNKLNAWRESFRPYIIRNNNYIYFDTLHEAICGKMNSSNEVEVLGAQDYETIILPPCTYYPDYNDNYTNRYPVKISKSITIKSIDPTDQAFVNSTIIDGEHIAPTITIEGDNLEINIIGITIVNGSNNVSYVDNGTGNNINFQSCRMDSYYWSFDGTLNDDLCFNGKWETNTNEQYKPNYVQGISGEAISFDGIDDYISIQGFKGVLGTQSRTCSAWIKTESGTSGSLTYDQIFSWGKVDDFGNTSSGSSWVVRLYQADINSPAFLRADVFGSGINATTTPLNDGQWHHIAVVLDSDGLPIVSDIKLYVDGILQSTEFLSSDSPDTYINTIANDNYDVTIGVHPENYTTYFNGLIDEPKIYGRALNSSEIIKDYHLLLVHYSFEEATGTNPFDNTFNERDGMLNLGSNSSGLNKATGIISECLEFDGIDDYVSIPGFKGVLGTQSRTCSAWIKTESGTSGSLTYDQIFSWGKIVDDFGTTLIGSKWVVRLYQADINSPAFLRAEVSGSGINATTTPINDGKWHHIAVVLDSDGSPIVSDIKLYVDGILQSTEFLSSQSPSLAINTIANDNYDVTIGVHPENYTTYFNGLIDEPKIYGMALSTSEIMDEYDVQLLVHYSFEEATGTDPYDNTFNERDGMLNLGNNGSGLNKATGVISECLEFDGIDDYVSIPGFKGVLGTQSRTCSAWIKTESGTSGSLTYDQIFSWGKIVDDLGTTLIGSKWVVRLYQADINSPAFLRAEVSGSGINATTTPLNDGQWHHIAAVLDSDGSPIVSDIKLYVDGILQSTEFLSSQSPSLAINTIANDNYDVTIGVHPENYTTYFNGLIDEPKIYGMALSTSEIMDEYDVQLLVHYSFEEATGTDPYDNTFNERDGILILGNNGSGLNKATGVISECLEFDGIDDYVSIPGYKGVLGTLSRTCSAWIKTESGTSGSLTYDQIFSWGKIVDEYGNTLSGSKWVVRLYQADINSPAFLRAEVSGSGINAITTPLNDGQWHHIAAVLDSDGSPIVSDIKLYVDGILQSTEFLSSQSPSLAINTIANDNYDVSIGVHPENYTTYFNGLIDEPKIYGMALSTSEILDEYNDQPLFHYSFEEATGIDPNDNTFNERDGMLNLGSNNSGLNKATGITSECLEFDGIDDYVSIPGFKGVLGIQSRTCSAWIKTESGTSGSLTYDQIFSWGKIIDEYGNTLSGSKWVVRLYQADINSPAFLRAEVSGSGINATTTPLNDGQWHHIAVVLDSDGSPIVSDIKLYVDGILQSTEFLSSQSPSLAINTIANDNYDVTIGIHPENYTAYFNGLIDEPKVYGRALSAIEILEDYFTIIP